jgi:hypothetical protein
MTYPKLKAILTVEEAIVCMHAGETWNIHPAEKWSEALEDMPEKWLDVVRSYMTNNPNRVSSIYNNYVENV